MNVLMLNVCKESQPWNANYLTTISKYVIVYKHHQPVATAIIVIPVCDSPHTFNTWNRNICYFSLDPLGFWIVVELLNFHVTLTSPFYFPSCQKFIPTPSCCSPLPLSCRLRPTGPSSPSPKDSLRASPTKVQELSLHWTLKIRSRRDGGMMLISSLMKVSDWGRGNRGRFLSHH